MNKQTEWKRVPVSELAGFDFTGAKSAHLEVDDSNIIALDFVLKSGQRVRIRRENYGVMVEAPVMPMDTRWQLKVGRLAPQLFATEQEAKAALENVNCTYELDEVQVPRAQAQLTELPF